MPISHSQLELLGELLTLSEQPIKNETEREQVLVLDVLKDNSSDERETIKIVL